MKGPLLGPTLNLAPGLPHTRNASNGAELTERNRDGR